METKLNQKEIEEQLKKEAITKAKKELQKRELNKDKEVLK